MGLDAESRHEIVRAIAEMPATRLSPASDREGVVVVNELDALAGSRHDQQLTRMAAGTQVRGFTNGCAYLVPT